VKEGNDILSNRECENEREKKRRQSVYNNVNKYTPHSAHTIICVTNVNLQNSWMVVRNKQRRNWGKRIRN